MKYNNRKFKKKEEEHYKDVGELFLAKRDKKQSYFKKTNGEAKYKLRIPVSNCDFKPYLLAIINKGIFIGVSDKTDETTIGAGKKRLLVIDFDRSDLISLDGTEIDQAAKKIDITILNDIRFYKDISKKKYDKLVGTRGRPGERGGGVIVDENE